MQRSLCGYPVPSRLRLRICIDVPCTIGTIPKFGMHPILYTGSVHTMARLHRKPYPTHTHTVLLFLMKCFSVGVLRPGYI